MFTLTNIFFFIISIFVLGEQNRDRKGGRWVCDQIPWRALGRVYSAQEGPDGYPGCCPGRPGRPNVAQWTININKKKRIYNKYLASRDPKKKNCFANIHSGSDVFGYYSPLARAGFASNSRIFMSKDTRAPTLKTIRCCLLATMRFHSHCIRQWDKYKEGTEDEGRRGHFSCTWLRLQDVFLCPGGESGRCREEMMPFS